MKNRTITHRDQQKADRLRRIWELKKRDLELTQVKASKQLGITQASFSQYLNCVIALNTDMTLKMAELLKVDAGDIDPKLKQQIRLVDLNAVSVMVAVVAAIPGPLLGSSVITVEVLGMAGAALYALLLTKAVGDIPANSYVLADPAKEVLVGQTGVLTLKDQTRLFGKLLSRNSKRIVFQDKMTYEQYEITPKDVFSLHGVHSIQYGE